MSPSCKKNNAIASYLGGSGFASAAGDTPPDSPPDLCWKSAFKNCRGGHPRPLWASCCISSDHKSTRPCLLSHFLARGLRQAGAGGGSARTPEIRSASTSWSGGHGHRHENLQEASAGHSLFVSRRRTRPHVGARPFRRSLTSLAGPISEFPSAAQRAQGTRGASTDALALLVHVI